MQLLQSGHNFARVTAWLQIGTVIRFASTSAKIGICTVVGLTRTLVLDQIRTYLGECQDFSSNKSPISNHGGASAYFSTDLT